MDSVPVRQCIDCGEVKPANNQHFGKSSEYPLGLALRCRLCHLARVQKQALALGWPDPPIQACKHCGAEHPATPEYFTYRSRAAGGITKVCLSCKRKKLEVLPEGMKWCRSCHKVKPHEEFYINATSSDGFERHCKACVQTKNRGYRQTQQYREAKKAHALRNRTELNAKARAWREKNRDSEGFKLTRRKESEKRKAFNAENPGLHYRKYRATYIARSARTRAERNAAPGEWDKSHVRLLFIRQRGCCFYCNAKVGGKNGRWEVDHFIPLSRGGTNFPSNLVIACFACNRSKHNALPWEWMPDRFTAQELPDLPLSSSGE